MLTVNQPSQNRQILIANQFLERIKKQYRTNANRRVDPTGTAGIRYGYEQEMRRRFSWLISLIYKTVVDNDALGLAPQEDVDDIPIFDPLAENIDPATRFEFTTDPAANVTAFVNWLNRAINEGILGVSQGFQGTFTETNWMDSHIRSAYSKALGDANAHLAAAGIAPGGTGVGVGFYLPIDTNTLNHLYSRQFELLKNTTTVMADGIREQLTLGLAEGIGPGQIAKNLEKSVNGIGVVRSVILARTEVINAYAEGTLNRYETFGTQGVVALVEFSNAGDDRVCELCIALEGKTYLVADARGVIPVHPQCRCTWLPVRKF